MVQFENGELTRRIDGLRHDLSEIFRAAVDASHAARLVRSVLASPEHRDFLSRPVHVLSVGKASAQMAAALDRAVCVEVAAGLVIGPAPEPTLPPGMEWVEGRHPVPDEHSVVAGRRALALARSVPADGRLLVLLSGGASALMALPRPGITLADKRETTGRLLLAGADIGALNTVRKHLSAVKGGQLAAATAGRVLTLAVSDVIGDDLSLIGSGPTVADPSTFRDALALLSQFGGVEVFPPAVVALLEAGVRGELPETPKPGEALPAGRTARVMGSRTTASAGAAAMAESLGYRTIVRSEAVTGEARDAGPSFAAAALRALGRVTIPTCVIATGETTVRVVGAGLGGRNQEVALSAAGSLADFDQPAVLLSGGTDGIDGPTDAAGAVCDVTTLDRARKAGLASPDAYLADNDAYHFFQALGDLVITGPTGTNVGDVVILLVWPGCRRKAHG